MPENTPYSDLKKAIEILEQKKTFQGQLLKDQFKLTIESLNPFHVLKNSFNAITGSPEVRNDLLGLLIPLATVIFSKNASAGKRRSPVFAQVGILIMDGINMYITRNPEIVKSITLFIRNIFRKKKAPEIPEE